MHQPHHPDLTQRVQRLLQLGWSLRRIARQLRISRRLLDRILLRPPDPSEIPDDPFWQARRRARRCPGCGGLVFHWPCLACELKAKEQRAAEMRKAA